MTASEGATERTTGRAVREATIGEWIDGLAERNGDPGGGAAGGVMLAMGAALTAMVAAYTGQAEVGERARDLAAAGLDRAAADSAASAEFGAALRSDDDARREEAALAAARSSAALATLAREVVAALEEVAGNAGARLRADVVAAASALGAATRCARANLHSALDAAGGEADPSADRTSGDEIAAAISACDETLARIDALHREAAPAD